LARKGLPKWAIAEARKREAKNIFAYAWSLVKRKRSPKPKTKKRSVRTVAKRKRRYSRSFGIPLAPIAGLAAGLVTPPKPGRDSVITNIMQGDWQNTFNALAMVYTGVDPATGKFDFASLKRGLVPLVAGLLIHKFIGGSPLNLNRMLARYKVPLIRI